jgi:hypothetical protein
MLKPFWRYYGGKWRAAPRYPAPAHRAIVEPFAGAAGYSLRYPERQVVLVERDPTIAELWRYLIGVKPAEVQRIPEVQHVEDLPRRVPAGGRSLVGFALNSGSVAPRRTLSAGRIQLASMGRKFEGWTPALRARVASQVGHVRHWRIIEGPTRLRRTGSPHGSLTPLTAPEPEPTTGTPRSTTRSWARGAEVVEGR